MNEALDEIKIAWQLDPLAPNVNTGLARMYHFRKEQDKALEQVNKTISMEPGYAEAHFTAGLTYYELKEYEKAVPYLEKAIELSGRRPVMLGMLGSVYALQGKMKEANLLLAELGTPPVNNDKLYAIAAIKKRMNNENEAMDILEKLLDEKYGLLIYMKVEKSYFEDIDSKRYQQMLDRIGL